jgi:hypothetical protein
MPMLRLYATLKCPTARLGGPHFYKPQQPSCTGNAQQNRFESGVSVPKSANIQLYLSLKSKIPAKLIWSLLILLNNDFMRSM